MASKTCALAKCKAAPTEVALTAQGDVGLCERHYKAYQDVMKPKANTVDKFGHRCPTIHDAIRENRTPTTAEMDSTCDDCRRKLVAQCSKCKEWHHFECDGLQGQVCKCGSTDFASSSLVSERTWNPLRKVSKL